MTQTAKKGDRAALLAAAAATLACGVFLLMQHPVRDGVRRGLVLCAGTLVPALFPFMVFSDVLAATGRPRKAGWVGRIFARAFALPERCVGIFLLGAICGIPLGARETARARRAGELDRESAERLVLMSNLCGPAFLIAGVGAGLRHSIKEGVLLYLIQLAAALISTWLFSLPRRKYRRQTPATNKGDAPRATNALPASTSANDPDASLLSVLPRTVTRAAGDMLGVCGSVCLFSAVSALFSACLPTAVAAVLSALTELTGGTGALYAAFQFSPSLSFALTSGAVAFGGMSIHMQAFVFLDGTDLRAGRYLAGKALSGAIALVFGAIVGRFL